MKNLYQDTIVAPATIPGTGAISIIRISGPEAFKIADAVVQLKNGTISSAKAYTIHYGSVSDVDGELLDEVLVSVFRAPHSYTGEDSVEISCHASSYIVSRLIRLLEQAGARLAQPGEYTRRAFINGKMDLAQAEAVADVIASETSASHMVAMNQLRGYYSKDLELLRSELLDMASLLELELDFSEEDVEFADRSRLLGLVGETLEHVDRLISSFSLGNIVKKGVPAAIIGPANAGKSTLLNALIGEDRAIVSDIPGTTRDTIEEVLNIDGVLFRFVDTAGLRESDNAVEKEGIGRTFRKLSEASAVLAVIDVTAPLPGALGDIAGIMDFSSQRLFILLNKVDLLSENDINKYVIDINKFVLLHNIQGNIILISAKCGKGIEELKNALSSWQKQLSAGRLDAAVVTSERHLAALQEASASLSRVRSSLSDGTPTDLIAEDLRLAISSVNSILGKDLLDPETVLHTIFARHCIGK